MGAKDGETPGTSNDGRAGAGGLPPAGEPPGGTDPEGIRHGKGSVLLLVPFLVGGALVVAAVGWVAAVQLGGGEAHGKAARLQFTSACGEEPRTAMTSRLLDYGLSGQFVGEGLELSLVTPGQDDDLQHMPIALSRPGRFEVWQNGALLYDHFQDAGVQISLMGIPVTLVTLPGAVEEEGLEVRIDGMPMEIESVNGNELQLASKADTSLDALRTATDRVVAIRHPLPCPVEAGPARWE